MSMSAVGPEVTLGHFPEPLFGWGGPHSACAFSTTPVERAKKIIVLERKRFILLSSFSFWLFREQLLTLQ